MYMLILYNMSYNFYHEINLKSNNTTDIISTTSPLDQFEIRNLLSIEAPILGNTSLSLTNIGLYLTIAGYLVFMINILSTNNNNIIKNIY